MDMIDRIARYLVSAREEPDPADNAPARGDDGTRYPAGVPRWKAHELQARDLLAAIREPTEAMVDAGRSALEDASRAPDHVWRTMISAALAAPPEKVD